MLYELAERIVAFMDDSPSFPWFLTWTFVAGFPLILLHEFGHAVAAYLLLGAEVEISVGSSGKIMERRLGPFAVTIKTFRKPGGAAGLAQFDTSRATARDMLCIALAGPLASLAGLAVVLALYSAGGHTGVVHDLLWAAVGFSIGVTLLNLIPFKAAADGSSPGLESDGRQALDALRVMWALR